MNKKLIFLDIDGTLVTDDKQIPEENKRILDQARAAGHVIVLASGRVINGVRGQAEKLGFVDEGCYIIGYNGAMAVDMHSGSTVYRKPVPREHVKPLFEIAARHGVHAQTYENDTVIVEADTPEIQFYSKTLNNPYKVVPDASEYLSEDPCKCLFVDLENREKLDALRVDVETYCQANGLQTFYSDPKYLDVVCQGVSKGDSIRFMSEKLGIPMENTIAAGDGENDISMIKAAAIGCAVSNASDQVKAAADYVTEADNNHCAVAEIIHKFVLCD